jgi:NAD(P)-dependent dehydrogenase (short-subunit alcohol dehydrogenase family)
MIFEGRAALITGGKRIGVAVAHHLLERGVDVAVTFNRSRREAEDLVARATAAGRRAHAMQADLANADDCARVVNEAAQLFGRLDILINMASVYREVALDQTGAAEWNAVLDVDLRAAFLCAQAAVPHMRRTGAGRIVNFSDWVAASRRPRYRGYSPYYVAKAGVIALTETLALELAADQILVNAVAPGPVLAPPGTSPEEMAAVEAATPLGRWGGEQEVVKAVDFLIQSDFVTGETIRVDGGRHVR